MTEKLKKEKQVKETKTYTIPTYKKAKMGEDQYLLSTRRYANFEGKKGTNVAVYKLIADYDYDDP